MRIARDLTVGEKEITVSFLVMTTSTTPAAMSAVAEFYRDKVIFITGATGLVGKCLVFRLLTSCEPRAIVVLLRGKRGVAFDERRRQFLADGAFDHLPDKTKLARVVAVEGDVALPRL